MDKETIERLSAPENKPSMTVFAGTNGAGKSHLTGILKHQHPDIEIIDADAIAKKLNPSDPAKANIAAGRITIERVRDAIKNGRSFSVETTLSGGNALRQMEMAKQAGYNIRLYFVGLDSADLHVTRVANRVAQGGHHIEEADIRRRYVTSLQNLPKAMSIAHHTFIFDNSEVYKLKVELDRGLIRHRDPQQPVWVDKALKEWEGKEQSGIHEMKKEQDRLFEAYSQVKAERAAAMQDLEPLKELERLQRQQDHILARLKELEPKGLFGKLHQPNRAEIEQLKTALQANANQIQAVQGKLPADPAGLKVRIKDLGNTMDKLLQGTALISDRMTVLQQQQAVKQLSKEFQNVTTVKLQSAPSMDLSR